MTTITHNNREFQVVEIEPISNYPALASTRPDVVSHFIAVGKRGSTICGYITKEGSYIVF